MCYIRRGHRSGTHGSLAKRRNLRRLWMFLEEFGHFPRGSNADDETAYKGLSDFFRVSVRRYNNRTHATRTGNAKLVGDDVCASRRPSLEAVPGYEAYAFCPRNYYAWAGRAATGLALASYAPFVERLKSNFLKSAGVELHEALALLFFESRNNSTGNNAAVLASALAALYCEKPFLWPTAAELHGTAARRATPPPAGASHATVVEYVELLVRGGAAPWVKQKVSARYEICLDAFNALYPYSCHGFQRAGQTDRPAQPPD